jgi:hypothetical protein
LVVVADGLLAVIPYQVALEKEGARRMLARKMLLPVSPHLYQPSSRLPVLPPFRW